MTANRRGRPPHPDVLTPAEWAVADSVRHGLTNQQIADRLGVGLDAVKFHVGNSLGKLGLGSRAQLRRWDGVRADGAMAKARTTMTGETRLGPIAQIARTVSDIAASEAWYRDVLGVPHLFTFGELAFFDCGGTRLYLQQGEKGAVPGPESILYFKVADIHAEHARLTAAGAQFIDAPHMVHRHEDGSEEWLSFSPTPTAAPWRSARG
jgi:DNA-binding CsgD family transcriptional regulator/catechol 2,3-dioxygenase-like lactoylglutathione lyase family enzyme